MPTKTHRHQQASRHAAAHCGERNKDNCAPDAEPLAVSAHSVPAEPSSLPMGTRRVELATGQGVSRWRVSHTQLFLTSAHGEVVVRTSASRATLLAVSCPSRAVPGRGACEFLVTEGDRIEAVGPAIVIEAHRAFNDRQAGTRGATSWRSRGWGGILAPDPLGSRPGPRLEASADRNAWALSPRGLAEPNDRPRQLVAEQVRLPPPDETGTFAGALVAGDGGL